MSEDYYSWVLKRMWERHWKQQDQAAEVRHRLLLGQEALEQSNAVPKVQPSPKAPRAIVWEGTVRSFGEYVLDLYKRKKIKATSKMNALEQMCPRYTQKDGAPMKPRAILQNLSNKREEGK